MRKKKLRGETVSLGDVIPGLLQRIEKTSGGTLPMIAAKWEEIVGPEVARHTTPGFFRGGRLTVDVDDSVWLAELARFHSGKIRQAVNESIGRDVVKTMFFRPKR